MTTVGLRNTDKHHTRVFDEHLLGQHSCASMLYFSKETQWEGVIIST